MKPPGMPGEAGTGPPVYSAWTPVASLSAQTRDPGCTAQPGQNSLANRLPEGFRRHAIAMRLQCSFCFVLGFLEPVRWDRPRKLRFQNPLQSIR